MHVFQQAKETFLLVKDPMIGGLNNQLMTFVAYGEIAGKANRTLVVPQFLGNSPKENVLVPVELNMCSNWNNCLREAMALYFQTKDLLHS